MNTPPPDVLQPAPKPAARCVSIEALVAELSAIAAVLHLSFPIDSKQEFVRQCSERSNTVSFQGKSYEAGFAAGLIPSFFFPLCDLQDLLGKTLELLKSRGWIE